MAANTAIATIGGHEAIKIRCAVRGERPKAGEERYRRIVCAPSCSATSSSADRSPCGQRHHCPGETPACPTAGPVAGERGSRGVAAAHAVDATAGRGTGTAEIDVLYRFSARPKPGAGRKISCWYSCDVPPLTAPVCRLASQASRSDGRRTVLPITLSLKPGAYFSSTTSTAADSCSAEASSATPRGRCV